MANPAQQSSAPPRCQSEHAVPPQHSTGGHRIPTLPQPPALQRSPALPALPSFLQRPTARWARGCLIAVNLAAVTFFPLSYSRHGVSFGPYRIDLNVYRIGSAVWLRGGNLYGALPPTGIGARLPFSYPPIAAVLLAPLALVPMPVAVTLLTTVTIALTALVLRVFLRSVSAPPTPSREVADSPDLCSVIATPIPARALPAAPPGLPPTSAPAAVFCFGPAVSWWPRRAGRAVRWSESRLP